MSSQEKRMLMLKNTGSHLFEEAYFVMSDSAKKNKVSESQLIKEANRIVNESFISGYFSPEEKKTKDVSLRAKLYLSGFVSGVGACLLFIIFFS